jgi:hypothetical protein
MEGLVGSPIIKGRLVGRRDRCSKDEHRLDRIVRGEIATTPSYRGTMIQVDIGGHPPIPLEPPPLLLSVFQFLHSLLFLAVFSGPELPGPF